MPLDFPLKFAYPIFYGNTSDKGDGRKYFIQTATQRGSDTIHSFLIQRRWILYFMRNSTLRKMTKGTFIGMVRATPDKFQFSVKVPETITHNKRLDITIPQNAMADFEEFLDKISPLKSASNYYNVPIEALQ